jgi:hypothetical protein
LVAQVLSTGQCHRHPAILKPTPDDPAFLICGLIALVTIRVLAFWSWRRLGRSTAR